MDVKLKVPNKVYYCKESKRSFTGEKLHEDVKVTQHIRGLLNDGSLVEVRTEEVSDEAKAKIIAEAKAVEAKAVEAERVAKLTPAEKAAETKAKKVAAEAAAKKKETA